MSINFEFLAGISDADYLTMSAETRMKGKGIVDRYPNDSKDDVLILQASLNDFDIDLGSGVTYRWKCVELDGRVQEVKGSGNQCVCVRETDLGKTFLCEVTFKQYPNVTLYDDYGPLTEADFMVPLCGTASIRADLPKNPPHQGEAAPIVSGQNRNTDSPPAYTQTFGNQKICAGTDCAFPINRGAEQGSHTITDPPAGPQPGALGNMPAEEFPQLRQTEPPPKPLKVYAPDFHCFDSNMGRLHYFVASRNDCYATNALEYIDCDALLYRLLKEQGYQRVIIVGTFGRDGSDGYPVITYDRLSQLTFLHPAEYENFWRNNQGKGEDALPLFYEEFDLCAGQKKSGSCSRAEGQKTLPPANANEAVAFGKRVIRTINRPGTPADAHKSQVSFEAFIVGEASTALQSDALKTAIVLPQELLLERGALTAIAAQKLSAHINRPSGSILVVTADRQEDLCRLFDGLGAELYRRVDQSTGRILSSFHNSSNAMAACDAFMEELSREGRILAAADTPGRDEIANLLFALKIRQPERFSRLPYARIYALSEFLSIKCGSPSGTKHALPEVQNNTWYIGPLQNLERALRSDSVLDALIQISASLWDRAVLPTDGLRSTYLERIYAGLGKEAVPAQRYLVSDQEKASRRTEAAEKLDKLVGLSTVKKLLNNRLAVAEAKVEPQPGHYIFAGSPGTGKTTVARLMGDLLRSRGLLAKGHVVEVSPEDLASDYKGGSRIKTQRKCEEALDGVLFLNEAHRLTTADREGGPFFPDHPYNKEAYAALLAFMKSYPNRICVICAGPPEGMDRFRAALPGMDNQIPRQNVIRFPDYSEDELYELLLALALQEKLTLRDDFCTSARAALRRMKEKWGAAFENSHGIHSFLVDCRDNALLRTAGHCLPPLVLTAMDIPDEAKEAGAPSSGPNHPNRSP